MVYELYLKALTRRKEIHLSYKGLVKVNFKSMRGWGWLEGKSGGRRILCAWTLFIMTFKNMQNNCLGDVRIA